MPPEPAKTHTRLLPLAGGSVIAIATGEFNTRASAAIARTTRVSHLLGASGASAYTKTARTIPAFFIISQGPPSPSNSHAGLSAFAIAAGGYHTCAIAIGGGVKCWGDNWAGQLGIGSYENQNRPADVTGAASGVHARVGCQGRRDFLEIDV
jgi:hypothetical protein